MVGKLRVGHACNIVIIKLGNRLTAFRNTCNRQSNRHIAEESLATPIGIFYSVRLHDINLGIIQAEILQILHVSLIYARYTSTCVNDGNYRA